MDFDDTPDEARFRAEARAWLEDNAVRRDGTSRPRSIADAASDEHVKRCKEWQATLHRGGWAGITWPREHGGRGGTPVQSAIFAQEQAAFDVSTGVFTVATGMVGPTLIAHGSREQQQRYLQPMLRGDEIWCQLFSEPGAGSDLAGLSTKAVRDGDDWVVNGQKVWTSGARHSDLAILLARTDPEAPKHAGITYFLLDMETPGIEVRPLRQINGAAHFSEVFLTDVRVPHENVVGELHGGWAVARTTLANERTAIGGGTGVGFDGIVDLARRTCRSGDRVARQDLAAAYTRMQVLRYLGYRVQTALSQGRMPGPESSVLKLAYSRHVAALGDLVVGLQGPAGTLQGEWAQQFLGQWSVRIGGGTDQIQRNIIGERVLGLPREPKG